jgi:hypothetical protein
MKKPGLKSLTAIATGMAIMIEIKALNSNLSLIALNIFFIVFPPSHFLDPSLY